MLFSHQYSRRFPLAQAFSGTQAGLDCCNTERLFTVCHRTQTAVCSFSLSSVLSSCRFQIPHSTRFCTIISLQPLSLRAVFICAFDKVSSQVLVGKDTTTLKSHCVGCYRAPLDEIFRTALSSSVWVVPMCIYRGTGSQPEHELNDKQQRTTTIL